MNTSSPDLLHAVTEVPVLPAGDDAFASLRCVLEKWFYQPDLQAIRIVLGTVAAHYLKIGDPAWLFIVAPPGTGKTTMSIMGASGLPEVISLSDFTENTFLSGFYRAKEPGLLEKLGHTVQDGTTYTTEGDGIILAKDFTTVLSMRREKRAVILGQLREIHDGLFSRAFGTGETKIWRGRVSIVAAVTPVLDRHYSIFTVLGERFLQVRWHRPRSSEAGEWAIRQQGQEPEIQKQAREAIKLIFQRSLQAPPVLTAEQQRRLASHAEIVALGRTHVFRSSYGSREIEYIPESEANTRISKGLAAIARGIAALNGREQVAEPDLQDALRVGWDSLPDHRRQVLMALMAGSNVRRLRVPRTVLGRLLEEMEALELIGQGDGPFGGVLPEDDVQWTLSPNVGRLVSIACPNVFEVRMYGGM